MDANDQPDGNCKQCKWNACLLQPDIFHCIVPYQELVNLICIQKRIMVNLHNIQIDQDDGEEWKQSE